MSPGTDAFDLDEWLTRGVALAREPGCAPPLVVVPFETTSTPLLPSGGAHGELAIRTPGHGYDLGAGRLDVPAGARAMLLAAPLPGLHNRMLLEALRAGIRTVVHPRGDGWCRSSLVALSRRRTRQALTVGCVPWIRRSRRLEDLLVPRARAGSLAEQLLRVRPQTATPREGIVFASPSLGPGGAERQMMLTLESLHDARVGSLRFLALEAREGFHRARLQALGIEIVDLARGPALAWRPGSGEPAVLDGLSPTLGPLVLASLDALTRVAPRVVHAWLDRAGAVVGLAAVLAGVPRIVLALRSVAPVHFPFYRPDYRDLLGAVVRMPGVVLTNNSAAGARSYETWLGLEAGRVQVQPNAVAPELREPPPASDGEALRAELGIPPGSPVLGGVFRLAPEKGERRWAATAALLGRSRPELRFLVVGDGPCAARFERRLARAGLGDRLHRIGPRADVRAALSIMSVQLLASPFEGSPNVLLESQALGVPVVTCARGGAIETFEPGTTGTFVPGGAPRDLADAVGAWLDDGERRSAAAVAGPRLVRARFDHARLLERTRALYEL